MQSGLHGLPFLPRGRIACGLNPGRKSSKVLIGLHDLRFLPLHWTLPDRTAKAGKPD